MTARAGGMLRAAATALTALVLAHNLIFLAGYRGAFDQAMTRTGHDAAWTLAVALSLSLAGSLVVAAAWRLRQLRRLARAMSATRLRGEPDGVEFARRWLRWWLAITLTSAVLFVAQENFEHWRVTQLLPGIGVLASAAYPNALAIIAAVALAVSLVAALLGWKLEILVARINAAQSAGRPATAPVIRSDDTMDRRRGSNLGRRSAGRAPPMGLAS